MSEIFAAVVIGVGGIYIWAAAASQIAEMLGKIHPDDRVLTRYLAVRLLLIVGAPLAVVAMLAFLLCGTICVAVADLVGNKLPSSLKEALRRA